jgi:hypothetical protein
MVTLLDGVTGEVLAGPVELPDITPASISAFGGHAWVGFSGTGRLVRVDQCPPGRCEGDEPAFEGARERLLAAPERLGACIRRWKLSVS